MDVRSANKVAILGRTVATQLFGDEDPIGKIVRIRNIPFTVVGVLKSRGFSMVGFDQDDLVLVPYTTAMRRLLNVTNLRTIIVQAQSAQLLPFIQDQITLLLRQLHKIGADKEDDFTVRTQQDIAEFATAQSRTMTILLGAIAGVSLIVGGIGIMNIMLVSVTERTREIGIRMAVGARPKDILLQFLIEAVTLSVLGGFLGIGLGVAVAHAIASKTGWPILTPMYAVVGAFVFSAVIGIFFGFYPARKASRLDPIEALRYE
jgi:putative ABC transport system permease protein